MRRQLRAVALLIALVGNLVWAIPYPRISEEDLEDPEWRQTDLALWHGWITSAGVSMELDGFARSVKDVASSYKAFVTAMRWPFKGYFEYTHTSQQWGLFAVVAERVDALVIEVRRDGEWEELYRRLGDNDWHDAQFKYRRVRGIWDGVKEEPKGTYKRFTVWTATTVFDEQPDVDRVRVLLERRDIPLPWEEPSDEVERRAERYHKRENHMSKGER